MTIVSYRKLFFDTFFSFEVKKHFLAYFYTHSIMNFILFVNFNEIVNHFLKARSSQSDELYNDHYKIT